MLLNPAYARALDLSRYHGQVVYIDFWASWCGPCRQSFPWMKSLQDTYAHQGFAVVAVNLDRDHGDAERFLGEFNPDFTILFDPAGDLAEKFDIHGMPASVLIDRRGVLRFTHVGFRPADSQAYENQIAELLAEK